jgi:hypothetical protein
MCYNENNTDKDKDLYMDKKYRDIIAKEFSDCVLNTIKRLENAKTHQPFHTALLSDEALFWSRFERSFSTSLGQRVIEEISRIVAIAGGASDAKRQKAVIVTLDTAHESAIASHMRSLRSGKGTKNWKDVIEHISSVKCSGKTTEHRIISDLWWIKDGIDNYMSIKTVKPNIDQTSVAKEDILRLTINDNSCNAYYGLYYNPYGEDRKSYAHAPPMGIFDFHNDDVVLIGKEYWDTLGGSGCYEEILKIAKKVGAETRSIIEKLR